MPEHTDPPETPSSSRGGSASATPSSGSGGDAYSREAYRILQIGFVVAPILAGADKFFHLMTDWSQYLAPFLGDLVGVSTFMAVVGLVEIVAGIGVAVKPRIFSYVVAAWLAGIIVNLLLVGGFLDVALRDLGLALGALALARLSHVHARS